MTDTQEKIKRIRDAQKQLIEEIKIIQRQCTHDNKYGLYECDTGNYCRGDDSYWINAHCLDCDKTWRINSKENKEEYYSFEGSMV